ncbi:MAG: HD domain-containing protein [Acidobacteria bacterium]|nr:HD domain-containing protein [Acidobacteriota bacterium]
MPADRLAQQIAFLLEADKLKTVIRRTPLVDASRRENSAEHSWHLVLAAMILREHAAADVDLPRVIEMLAVHDLVEIDAGDTFAYDATHQLTKDDREAAAADRLFPMLPPDQAKRLRALWEEFEAGETPDARFASALDRLQPLLQNAGARGGSWRDYDVNRGQVLRRMAPIESALPAAWPIVLKIVEDFCASGVLRREQQ